MATHIFYFKKEDIHEKVYQRSSKIANARRDEGGKILEHLIFHRAEETLFSDFFDITSSDIFDTLSEYCKCTLEPDSGEDEAIENMWFIGIDMPKSFNTNQIKPVNTELCNALVNGILSQWFQICLPSDAEFYNSMYAKGLSNIRFKLSERVRPIIRPFNSFP